MLLLPENTTFLKHEALYDLVDHPMLIMSDMHWRDMGPTDPSTRHYDKVVRLCEWAMDEGYRIVFNGDSADLAAGYTQYEISRPRQELLDKLDAYGDVVWMRGNHDFSLGRDWKDGIEELRCGKTLIHHGNRFYWANYGVWGWLIGKPIIAVISKLKHDPSERGWGKWLAQHTYFSNKTLIRKGLQELVQRKLACLVTGHTHQPMLTALDGKIILNVGDMVTHGTFGIITPGEGVALCE